MEPVVGWWLVVLCALVLSRHRRNIRAWWVRRRRWRRCSVHRRCRARTSSTGPRDGAVVAEEAA